MWQLLISLVGLIFYVEQEWWENLNGRMDLLHHVKISDLLEGKQDDDV